MQFTTQLMTKELALQMLHWKYEPPYNFYNNSVSKEVIDELCAGNFTAVFEATYGYIGFFCTGATAQVPAGFFANAYPPGLTDIGLGMKPAITGQGYGTAFFQFIEQCVRQQSDAPLRLTVADFNKRAYHLYEKCGFKAINSFYRGTTKFIVMIKK